MKMYVSLKQSQPSTWTACGYRRESWGIILSNSFHLSAHKCTSLSSEHSVGLKSMYSGRKNATSWNRHDMMVVLSCTLSLPIPEVSLITGPFVTAPLGAGALWNATEVEASTSLHEEKLLEKHQITVVNCFFLAVSFFVWKETTN